MAIVRAVKSGNWSDPTTWNTGALPTSADDVYSNTFTVTIDQNINVQNISNGSATGVTAGGSIVFSGGAAVVYSITGNITSANNAATFCTFNGSGTINLTGNVTSASSGSTVITMTSGTLNCTGNIQAGNGPGINITAATLNVTGSVSAGSNAQSDGIRCSNNVSVNVIGTVTGGGASPGIGFFGNNGNFTVTGTCIAGSQWPAIANRVDAVQSSVVLSGPFICSSSGVVAVSVLKWTWPNNPSATYFQIRTANLATIRPLYTADSVGGNPATSNVRSGTVYGPNNELTGTCAVPPAGSVALGVPVDNTTGTAYLTQSDISSAATAALTAASAVTFNQDITTLNTPGSIGERLKNSATVATVSQQLSDALSSRV